MPRRPGLSLAYDRAVTVAVEFLDDRWELVPGHDFTFGRAADLCVDDSNLYLHRVVGLLRHSDDTWWLHNVGEWLELEIRTVKGNHHKMAPSTRLAVVSACDVRFAAGNAKYLINIIPKDPPRVREGFKVIADAPSTNRFAVIDLNDEQRLLLAALCEHQLQPSDGQRSLPSNNAVAVRLGWSVTKFNRKLDYLCRRLTSEGVAGLRGGRGERATARREHLVDHAITTGLISEDDLHLLD